MPAFGPCRRACGCAGLFFCRRTPLSCLSSPHRSLPRLSSRLPFFSCRPAFPTARVSLCPCLPLSVFLSARNSPALSVRPQSSVFRLVFLLSFLVFPFIVHRLPLVVRRPLRRPSSSACRLLSIARCAVHRPSPAACCPSPIVYPLLPIVHPLPPVVCCPSSIVHPLPPAVYRLLRRPYPVAFICTPSPRRASFRCRSVRITAFVSAESRPACLRELLAVSFRSGFRRSVFPQKCVRPPYLGRRAVSDKITPCILLSGAIFPARPAILLTIWQRLPFGTTFVQIQGVTGAPDPQGGRTPAARKENGKNINN